MLGNLGLPMPLWVRRVVRSSTTRRALRSRARSATDWARATRSTTWAVPTRLWASRRGQSSTSMQALAIAREVGDRRGERSALGDLGLAYAELGEPRRSIECCEQALAIARETGDRRVEGITFAYTGPGLCRSWGMAAGDRVPRAGAGDRTRDRPPAARGPCAWSSGFDLCRSGRDAPGARALRAGPRHRAGDRRSAGRGQLPIRSAPWRSINSETATRRSGGWRRRFGSTSRSSIRTPRRARAQLAEWQGSSR